MPIPCCSQLENRLQLQKGEIRAAEKRLAATAKEIAALTKARPAACLACICLLWRGMCWDACMALMVAATAVGAAPGLASRRGSGRRRAVSAAVLRFWGMPAADAGEF